MKIRSNTGRNTVLREVEYLLNKNHDSLNRVKEIFNIKFKHLAISKLAALVWMEILEIKRQYVDLDDFDFDLEDFIEYQVFIKEENEIL